MRRRSPSARLIVAAERHTFALGIAVLAVVALLAYVSVIAINGVPFAGTTELHAVVPEDAPPLKDGDEVRVAGQRAGEVREVEPARGGGTRIRMAISDTTVGEGAEARVRLRGLAGATYVEIAPGDPGRALPEGAEIPLSRASSGTELTDVVAGFDADARRALGRTLDAYGNGLLGRGADLNRAVEDLAPALEEGAPLLEAMTPRPGELSGLVGELRRTARGLAPEGSDALGRVLPEASEAFGATARAGDDIGAAIERMRPLEDELARTLPLADALLDDASVAARALTPGIEALTATLPDLERLLASGRGLTSLSQLARDARAVLAEGAPLLRELSPALGSLQPLASELEPLSDHLAGYREELFLGPNGFIRWGGFRYRAGQASGARAVRFAPVFTRSCGRVAYPAPNTAAGHREECLP